MSLFLQLCTAVISKILSAPCDIWGTCGSISVVCFLSLPPFGHLVLSCGMTGNGAYCVPKVQRFQSRLSLFIEEGAFSWSAGGAGTCDFVSGGERVPWGHVSVFTETGYFRFTPTCFWFTPTYRIRPFSKAIWDVYQGLSSLRALTSYLPCPSRLSKAGSSLLVSQLLFAAWSLRLWSQAAELLTDAWKEEGMQSVSSFLCGSLCSRFLVA